MVAKEYHFVFWMDASIRFHSSSIGSTLQQAKRTGLLFSVGDGAVAMRTYPATFQYLNEEPCTFRDTVEVYATFVIIFANTMITEHILKPWTSCALALGCMLPDTDTWNYIHCGHHGYVYHDCHRFDQSVLGILTYRLFNNELEDHMIKPIYTICKGCTTWNQRLR